MAKIGTCPGCGAQGRIQLRRNGAEFVRYDCGTYASRYAERTPECHHRETSAWQLRALRCEEALSLIAGMPYEPAVRIARTALSNPNPHQPK